MFALAETWQSQLDWILVVEFLSSQNVQMWVDLGRYFLRNHLMGAFRSRMFQILVFLRLVASQVSVLLNILRVLILVFRTLVSKFRSVLQIDGTTLCRTRASRLQIWVSRTQVGWIPLPPPGEISLSQILVFQTWACLNQVCQFERRESWVESPWGSLIWLQILASGLRNQSRTPVQQRFEIQASNLHFLNLTSTDFPEWGSPRDAGSCTRSVASFRSSVVSTWNWAWIPRI